MSENDTLFDGPATAPQTGGGQAGMVEMARAEDARRASEEIYRTLFETINEGLLLLEVVTDQRGRVVDCIHREVNSAFSRLTGRPIEIVGKRASELLPRLEQHWLDLLTRVYETGEPLRSEEYSADRGRWMRMHYSRAGGAGSRLIAVVLDDITERKQREEHQAFLLKLSDALRAEPDAAAVANRSVALLANELRTDRCYIAAFRPEANYWDVVAETSRPHLRPLPAGMRAEDHPESIRLIAEQTLVYHDIAEHPGLTDVDRASLAAMDYGAMVAAMLRRGPGNAEWGMVAVAERPRQWTPLEIALVEQAAERTWAAIERARGEEALRESEQRYRTLFESIDEGFCIVEMLFDEHGRPADYRFLEMNPAFMAQTGLANAKGRTILEMVPGHERHWFDVYGKIALTGQPARFQQEARHLDPPRWYDVYAFRYGPAEKRQVAVLFNDIAPRKQAEEALRKANFELAEADQRKDEFLAMLGHELRNPLAAIRNATEVMKLIAPGDSRLERARGVLDRQSTHMTRLIDGLLEVSRIARGKIQLSRETLDARAIVRGVLSDQRSQADTRGLELSEEVPSEPVWIEADHVRIAQVLDNLVGNAIKFTEAGGSVHVMLRAQEDHALFRVRDTGIGIRTETLGRLFEPFQQESQELARSAGGLGLGLAVAKGLVELHGGTIKAHSAGLRAGAELEVRLPLAAPPEGQRDGVQPTQVASRRILVVEDNTDAGQSLHDLLTLLGHSVEVVKSGPEAMVALSQHGADVVLCDLGLPGMSGYDVARAVRSTASLASLRLVAVTGYGQPEDRRRTAEAGFDDHLTKPIGIESLSEVLGGL